MTSSRNGQDAGATASLPAKNEARYLVQAAMRLANAAESVMRLTTTIGELAPALRPQLIARKMDAIVSALVHVQREAGNVLAHHHQMPAVEDYTPPAGNPDSLASFTSDPEQG